MDVKLVLVSIVAVFFVPLLTELDLGKRQQTQTPINDVILPKWASSAEDFVQKNREALVIGTTFPEQNQLGLNKWVLLATVGVGVRFGTFE